MGKQTRTESDDMIRYAGKKGEEMAYRYGNREQFRLLPASIEDYVSKEDAVRAYDAFVEALNFVELGIELDDGQVGNSEYDPKAMLKLLVYGYSYGVKGSRKLERECHHNLSFMWLMGGLKPDHKTIAEYRRRHKEALKKVLKQCVRLCIKLDLIAGNVLFVDGTKIRANAGRANSHGREWYEKRLKEIDNRIEQLLEDMEKTDEEEADLGSSVEMNTELAQAQGLKDKIQAVLKTMEESGREKMNLTDPDCAIMHSVHGSHASYNVQAVTDDKHGLLVHVEAVNDTSDVDQFARQIEAANEDLAKVCEVACGDAGYANTEELKKIDEQGVKVVVPRSVRRYTTKRIRLLIRVISATTSNGTVTFVRNNKCLRTSLPIVSEGGNTTGSPRREYASSANTLVSAPRTRRAAGSCACCSRIARRSSKPSTRILKTFMIAARRGRNFPSGI